MALLDLLGRRWMLRIMWELRDEAVPTFRELQQRCGGVSSSVLTQRLTDLREAGILERGDDGYRLTERGAELLALLRPMERWASAWR
jgi:DNA-binding HxlR family transcriptional regulator